MSFIGNKKIKINTIYFKNLKTRDKQSFSLKEFIYEFRAISNIPKQSQI